MREKGEEKIEISSSVSKTTKLGLMLAPFGMVPGSAVLTLVSSDIRCTRCEHLANKRSTTIHINLHEMLKEIAVN